MTPLSLTAAEVLADALRRPEPLVDTAVALRLDGSPDLEPAAAMLRAQQRIVIGVGHGEGAPLTESVASACDAILAPHSSHIPHAVTAADPESAARDVLAAIARNPAAAVVLADVLRASETLPVVDALHVESLAYSALLAGAEFSRWLGGRGERPAAASDHPPVRVEREGDELRVVLDDPARRNAYSAAMRDALVDALLIAEADPGIARVRLSGSGPSFCAGGDLTEFGTNRDGAQTHLLRTRGGAAAPLHRMAPRVEAVVHGHCIGAGMELPAFAHRVTVRGAASFRLPEVAMGLIPGAGGTVSIPRRIGRHRTFWLAVTGAVIDEQLALGWGLVDAVRPDETGHGAGQASAARSAVSTSDAGATGS